MIELRHRRLFMTLFFLFAVYGTSFTIIGATLPKILADFAWNYLVAGIVIGAGAVAYFVFTYVAGHLVKRYGPRTVFLLGLGCIVSGLACFAAVADPLSNAALSALIGAGQGCIEIGVNWTTLRINPHGSGRPMNLIHGAFAVGAIAGPLAVSLLIASDIGWTLVFRGIAAIFAVLAVVIVFTPLPDAGREGTVDAATAEPAHRSAAYWLAFGALLLYVGVELGVSNWVAEYFSRVFAYSAAAGAFLVSLFWVGVLAGRFGMPLLYKGDRHEQLLVVFSGLAASALVALTLLGYAAPTGTPALIGPVLVFLVGLGCSIYYPTVITLVGKCFPHAQGNAVGFAATGGGIGAFAFPFISASLAEGWGMRAGFAFYATFAIAMTVVAARLASAAARTAAPRMAEPVLPAQNNNPD